MSESYLTPARRPGLSGLLLPAVFLPLLGIGACQDPVDNDGDGYTSDQDCDDSDPNINPGAAETCDGLDNNCDGQTDETGCGTSAVVHTTDQGFDACTAPSASTMQTWINSSPYQYLGIYIGGSARACSQANLTASWIDTTTAQGWTFIPIWVGPQAPCSGYSNKFSYDTGTAYNQGYSEANSAAAAANSLGLEDSIVYYDIEYYDETSSCISAVTSFLAGWSDGLHANGFTAAVYGSACNADNFDDGGGTVPDAVWGANWTYSYYNANASPYGMSCLSDSAWYGERLRQYAGGHNESWGGVTINIDCNVGDGPVATNGGSLAPVAIDLLSADEGWYASTRGFFWTVDGGDRWQDRTPRLSDDEEIASAQFLDARQGWLMTREGAGFSLLRTDDGGQSWQRAPFAAPDFSGHFGSPEVFLHRIDRETGFATFKLATGLNFSRGLLFRTDDAGETWRQLELPLGEPVHFSSKLLGWVAGGPEGSQLYRTVDGGSSWEAVRVLPASADRSRLEPFADQPRYGTPLFTSERNGVLPVLLSDGRRADAALYTTRDGGSSWTLATRVGLDRALTTRGALTSATLDRLASGTLDLSELRGGIGFLEFASDRVGWALASNGECDGGECSIDHALMRSSDGGATWTRLALPE